MNSLLQYFQHGYQDASAEVTFFRKKMALISDALMLIFINTVIFCYHDRPNLIPLLV